MASSIADWVLGVARLISSASTIWEKTGPGWNSKTRRPSGSSMTMFVPMMSAGIRSGVNWMRLKSRSIASASVRTSSVLPRPGTPSSRACPPMNRQVRTPWTISSWPTMTLAISDFTRSYDVRNSSERASIDSTSRRERTSTTILSFKIGVCSNVYMISGDGLEIPDCVFEFADHTGNPESENSSFHR